MCGSNTTTSTSSPPKQFLDAYDKVLNQAYGVTAQPLQQYDAGPNASNIVAPLTGAQEGGLYNTDAMQGAYQPYLKDAYSYMTAGATPWDMKYGFDVSSLPGMGLDAYGQATQWASLGAPPKDYAASIAQYYNPYEDQVVNSTADLFSAQNADQFSSARGNAISQGAFGGDREAVMASELARNQKLAQDPVLAGLRDKGYANSQKAMTDEQALALQAAGVSGNLGNSYWGAYGREQGAQEAHDQGQRQVASNSAYGFGSLGQLAQSLGYTDANALLSAGALRQGQNQQVLNVPYQQFQQRQAWPYQTTGWLANIATGLGGSAGGNASTTYPGPSAISQIGGLATAGAGVYGLGSQQGWWGGGGANYTPEYTAYNGALGGDYGGGGWFEGADGGAIPQRGPGGLVPDLSESPIPGAMGFGTAPAKPGGGMMTKAFLQPDTSHTQSSSAGLGSILGPALSIGKLFLDDGGAVDGYDSGGMVPSYGRGLAMPPDLSRSPIPPLQMPGRAFGPPAPPAMPQQQQKSGVEDLAKGFKDLGPLFKSKEADGGAVGPGVLQYDGGGGVFGNPARGWRDPSEYIEPAAADALPEHMRPSQDEVWLDGPKNGASPRIPFAVYGGERPLASSLSYPLSPTPNPRGDGRSWVSGRNRPVWDGPPSRPGLGGYDDGGFVPRGTEMGGGDPIQQQALMQRYSMMPPDQIKDMAGRFPPGTPQGQALQQMMKVRAPTYPGGSYPSGPYSPNPMPSAAQRGGRMGLAEGGAPHQWGAGADDPGQYQYQMRSLGLPPEVARSILFNPSYGESDRRMIPPAARDALAAEHAASALSDAGQGRDDDLWRALDTPREYGLADGGDVLGDWRDYIEPPPKREGPPPPSHRQGLAEGGDPFDPEVAPRERSLVPDNQFARKLGSFIPSTDTLADALRPAWARGSQASAAPYTELTGDMAIPVPPPVEAPAARQAPPGVAPAASTLATPPRQAPLQDPPPLALAPSAQPTSVAPSYSAGLGSQVAAPRSEPAGIGGSPDGILPTIRKYESEGVAKSHGISPYAVGYGGVDLSGLPQLPSGFPKWEGKMAAAGITHAGGAYQFQPGTWKHIADKYFGGYLDFSKPENQDAAARRLYLEQGITPWSSNGTLMSALGRGERGSGESSGSSDPARTGYMVEAPGAGAGGDDTTTRPRGLAGGFDETSTGRDQGWRNALNSPWMALIAAGAGMLASRSPHPGVALGEGMETGLKFAGQMYDRDTKAEMAEVRRMSERQKAEYLADKLNDAAENRARLAKKDADTADWRMQNQERLTAKDAVAADLRRELNLSAAKTADAAVQNATTHAAAQKALADHQKAQEKLQELGTGEVRIIHGVMEDAKARGETIDFLTAQKLLAEAKRDPKTFEHGDHFRRDIAKEKEALDKGMATTNLPDATKNRMATSTVKKRWGMEVPDVPAAAAAKPAAPAAGAPAAAAAPAKPPTQDIAMAAAKAAIAGGKPREAIIQQMRQWGYAVDGL